jgi:hypothetical protein
MSDYAYAIALPDEWHQLEGPDASLETSINREFIAADIAERLPELDGEKLKRVLIWWARQLRHRGLVLAALFAEPFAVPESTDPETGELVPESVSVLGAIAALAFVSRESLDVDGLQTINAGVLIGALEREVDSEWQPLRPPTRIELASGAAAERVRLAHRGEDSILECSYYIPCADGELLALLSFVTPSVYAADEMLGLFRAIADTLEIFDQTPPAAEPPKVDAQP